MRAIACAGGVIAAMGRSYGRLRHARAHHAGNSPPL